MSEEKNSKIIERGLFLNNYLRGVVRDSKVSTEYSDGIWEIKRLLGTVMANADSGRASSDMSEEKKGLVITVIGVILWLIMYSILPNGDGVSKIRAFYIIVLLCAIYTQIKDMGKIAVAAVAYFVAAWFGFTKILTIVILILFAIITFKKIVAKRAEESTYKKTYNRLLSLQKRLTQLLPEIRRELNEWQRKWYNENKELLTEDDIVDFQEDSAFPPAFWWQVEVADVQKLHSVINCNKYADWEIRIIPKEAGAEFEATDEYSPLFAPLEADNATIMSYFRDEANCMVYDAISRAVFTTSQAKTVSYEVPAHSTMQRLAAHMSVYSLASDIDKAYNEGKLEYGDYNRLANEMFSLGRLAAEYSNATKTEQYIKYIPIHQHTDTWTGQFMLKEIPDQRGGKCLAVMQYYCQFPHLLENIKTLDGFLIGYIDYDFWQCNPYFLARFYARHPECQ